MRSVGLLVALVLTTGCGPNTPTDQSDTRFNAEIDGPWSITTYGDTITLTIRSTPPWTGVAPVWSPESTAAFKWLGDGRLVSTMNAYSPQTVHVTAALGPHLLSHDLVFRDVIASMGFFSKAGDSAVLVDTLRLTGVGDRQPFRIAPIDSGGTPVVSSPVYFGNIRDPQIIQMDGTYAYGMHSGQTWVVAWYLDIVDSALVIVP